MNTDTLVRSMEGEVFAGSSRVRLHRLVAEIYDLSSHDEWRNPLTRLPL